ncbi:MAG TPA: hypothetical protein VD999_05090 [Vitreimonas sp.]|nr:hypothetical protein [Vitreimonas sp.]
MRPHTFWHVLSQSLTSLAYYRDIIRAPFWFSLRFFMIAFVFFTLSRTGFFLMRELPQIDTYLTRALEETKQHFPRELAVNWQNQRLSHTSSSPVQIRFPSFITESMRTELELPSSIAYIFNQEFDPTTAATTLPTSSMLAVTPTLLYSLNVDGQWAELPLTRLPGFDKDFTITADNFSMYATHITQFHHSLKPYWIWITPFILGLWILISRLILIFSDTLLIFLLLKLNGSRISFMKVLQLALHFLVVAEFLNQISLWLYGNHQFPLLSLTFWILAVLVMWEMSRPRVQIISKR